MSDNYGVKISLPGYDVGSATPEQCAIHSGYDTFKVNSHASPDHFGLVNITFNDNPPAGVVTTLYSINHGYNYRPSLMTFISNGIYGTQSTTGHIRMDVDDRAWIECNVTDTQLNIQAQGFGVINFTGSDVTGEVGNVMTVRFYIFSEDGD